ncbi:MAG: 50S ribosomal protein L19 [Chloroflexi bacterium]|nr:50S ribosomal protein L19 [Chloroflexota bacterium]
MTEIETAATPETEKSFPDLRSGDTVRVHARIVEGDRERIQVFQGTVIRTKKGVQPSFTVRRIAANGIGVERTFLSRSPRIEKVEIMRRSKVHRDRLFYLRNIRGKAARLKDDRAGFDKLQQ